MFLIHSVVSKVKYVPREEDGSEESLGYLGNLQENSSASSSSVKNYAFFFSTDLYRSMVV